MSFFRQYPHGLCEMPVACPRPYQLLRVSKATQMFVSNMMS